MQNVVCKSDGRTPVTCLTSEIFFAALPSPLRAQSPTSLMLGPCGLAVASGLLEPVGKVGVSFAGFCVQHEGSEPIGNRVILSWMTRCVRVAQYKYSVLARALSQRSPRCPSTTRTTYQDNANSQGLNKGGCRQARCKTCAVPKDDCSSGEKLQWADAATSLPLGCSPREVRTTCMHGTHVHWA